MILDIRTPNSTELLFRFRNKKFSEKEVYSEATDEDTPPVVHRAFAIEAGDGRNKRTHYDDHRFGLRISASPDGTICETASPMLFARSIAKMRQHI